MKLLFGDFETYYNDSYTLRLQTPVEYILDHRWEMIGCSVRSDADDDFNKFLEHDDFVKYLETLDPDDTAFVSFNALFDACIMAWRYNFHPKLFIDAMGMARALVKHLSGRMSLDAVAQHLEVGKKQIQTIKNVKGMCKQAIKDAGLWVDYATYSKQDNELLRGIFHKLKPLFPIDEYLVMDGVIRATVYPQFRLNSEILHGHLQEVKAAKWGLITRCGLQDREQLMSDDKFAQLLMLEGVMPPRKVTPKGNEKWAFAKTDEEFTELAQHPNPNVQALVAARLGNKTTLEESRTGRMIAISQLHWPDDPRNVNRSAPDVNSVLQPGWMPVPLKYSGAHTHRLSGDWGLNMQNLTRGGKMRDALVAPQGFVVVAADASQIEARLTAWFCEQEDLRLAFENGDDIYSIFAGEEIFHYPVSKSTKMERFIGKQGILGGGFGAGGKKFAWMVETLSRLAAAAGALNEPITMDEDEGKRVINSYRRRYRNISRSWPQLLSILPKIAAGDTGLLGCDGVVSFGKDHIRLPNGLCLYYVDLQYSGKDWSFKYGSRRKWLHGGKILENIIQALARIIVMDAATRMRKKYKLHYALQCHDELVYVVPSGSEQFVQGALTEEMTTRPHWGPTIPLAVESAIGHSYGDVK